jgi:CIC family chloride channel protein
VRPYQVSPAIRLTVLGALSGLAAGAVVLSFRWLVEWSQSLFLPGRQLGNYEALAAWAILTLPLLGGLILGLLFERFPHPLRQVGVVHVVQQLRHSGRPALPIPNAVVQFLAGALAIVSGQSVDREGPGVHLGAATGTVVGWTSDDADTFTLTAAGAAASIAAAFNTPLAGVAFVIEVLGVRYRVDRFIPIMTASVAGALVGRAAYGPDPSFSSADVVIGHLSELPLLALLGLIIGLLGALFVSVTEHVRRRTDQWRPSVAFTLAGLITGMVGLFYPQVLGVGYDTLDGILTGRLVGPLLAGLALAKLLTTAVSGGLRIPGGLIGPSVVIGGAVGAFLGDVFPTLMPFPIGNPGFYATVGMLAMMSAVLRAPMAAMLALLELTGTSAILFPGMTAVVAADLVVRQLLGMDSVFEHLRRLAQPSEPNEET